MNVETLRIFRRESPVKVLGPYARAVIWVQGCSFGCPNCIVPESWAMNGGELVEVNDLADWTLQQHSIEGVTLSGGEPMLQAAALVHLIDKLKTERDLGVVCYTGYTRELLMAKGGAAQRDLLARIDLLIDGVYLEGRHGSLLWRGSGNQRLIQLSPRYQAYLAAHADVSAGLEVVMDEQGGIGYAGVPDRPGFRDAFLTGMKARGVRLGYRLSPK